MNRKFLLSGILIQLTSIVCTYFSFPTVTFINIVLFMFFPGALLFSLFATRKKISFIEICLYSIGVSLFVLMSGGVIINLLLPHFGVSKPLSEPYIDVTFHGITGILFLTNLLFKKKSFHIDENFSFHKSDILLLLFSFLLPLLSIGGAIRLNNNVTNELSIASLLLVIMIFVFTYLRKKRLNTVSIAISIFFIAFSLLFMTSLRGYIPIGHDIKKEYQLFIQTMENGVWNPLSTRDAYNSCLSITILPTILSHLLKISEPYIYKIIFQLIFAFVPVGIFMLISKFSSWFFAYLGSFIFILFPTFMSDMPMLNRQEIAMLFFMLFIDALLRRDISEKSKTLFMYMFGIGIAISHYSTSYITLGLLVLTFTGNFIVNILLKKNIFKIKNYLPHIIQTHSLKFTTILFYGVFVFLWNSQITNTFNGPITVIKKSISNLNQLFKDDLKSSDTSVSLFFSNPTKSSTQLLETYKNTATLQSPLSQRLFTESDIQPLSVNITPEKPVNKTKFGLFVQSMGLNLFSLNSSLRQVIAKLLQILILIGLIPIFIKKSKYIHDLSSEMIILMCSFILFIFIVIIFPNLSVEYGILRFFQQSLIVLCVPMTLGIIYLLGFGKLKFFAPVVVYCFFFLVLSSLFSELTGGFTGVMYLDNSGGYYNRFYFSTAELDSYDWLVKNVHNYDIVQYNKAPSYLIPTQKKLRILGDVLPTTIEKNSYLYLTESNIKKNMYYFFYTGDTLSYSFDTQKILDYKNLIYNNSASVVAK